MTRSKDPMVQPQSIDIGEAPELEQLELTPLKLEIQEPFEGAAGKFLQELKDFADQYIINNFGNLLSTVEEIYSRVRIVEKTNEDGTKVYKKRPDGLGFEENFSKLSVEEIDHFILSLSTESFMGSPKVDDLYMEASFAKALYDEEYYLEYQRVNGRYKNDKDAVIVPKLRQKKFDAWARSYLYYNVRDLLSESDKLARRLENVRSNYTRDTDRYLRGKRASRS